MVRFLRGANPRSVDRRFKIEENMDKSKIPTAQRQALGALLDDHRAVKKLFKSFEENKSGKQAIASETCHQLEIHAQLEEEIFYPALRGVSDKLDDMLDEAKVEHGVAKDLIAAIRNAADSDTLDATYKVLTEYVGHHVEEEESEMFETVIKRNVDLREVATQMAARKEELLAVPA